MTTNIDNTERIPVKEIDYLEEDKQIRGQNYVCLSFISPEDVILNKEVFTFNKFIGQFGKDVKEMLENVKTKYPESEDMIQTIIENYSYVFEQKELQDQYSFYKTQNHDDINKDYYANNEFQTSIRGIKVRGVFDTIDEARIRAKVLNKMGDKFNIYVGQVGCWCPWSPDPNMLEDQEYAETELNTLMKKYKDNMSIRDLDFETRKTDKLSQLNNKVKIVSSIPNTATPIGSSVFDIGNKAESVDAGLQNVDAWTQRKAKENID